MARNCTQSSAQDLDRLEAIEVIRQSTNEVIAQAIFGMLTDPEVAWMRLWELVAITSSGPPVD